MRTNIHFKAHKGRKDTSKSVVHFMSKGKMYLSTNVSHGELQKWHLLTGSLCSERQKLPIQFSQDWPLWTGKHA